MSTKEEDKTKGRRSSLKPQDSHQLGTLKIKNKRNSVSWGQSNTFQFKAMKAMFQESNDLNKPVDEKKHKQFLETRKKSIKNEFSIVKELMKNNAKILEEDEGDDELKKNTDKNVLIGKEGLNEESESGSSSGNESNESDDDEEEEEKPKDKK